jgi:hypothetical protein
MKARSASMTLYHFAEKHHREVCMWHDRDHKPEVVATMPHVFISQRWVAPPDLAASRSEGTLPHNGGEYVNLYWSSGSVEELESDFSALGRRLELVGRMEPMKYIERTWGARLRPVSVQARPGLPLSGEAVTFAPQMTGMWVVIGELQNVPRRAEYARWHETEHIPQILDTGIFAGAAKLMSGAADEPNTMVTLYYTDREDPGAARQEFRRIASTWPAHPAAADVMRQVHSGIYRPSIGFYEFYA